MNGVLYLEQGSVVEVWLIEQSPIKALNALASNKVQDIEILCANKFTKNLQIIMPDRNVLEQ